MEIKEMNFEELETRRAELADEIPTADAERLDAINAELDAIEERKKEIKAEAEERAKAVDEVIKAPAPEPIIEERKKEMTDKERRSTPEYIDAFVEYVKRGYDLEKLGEEKRALLTENATNGTIAVPVYVEDRINTAWESDDFMRRIHRTFFAGNVKVGVEVSADPAQVHAEGGAAITEENLTIDYVDLIPEYLKKMVRVSHTAMALRGTAFLDYLYDEIEHQIVLKAKSEAIKAVIASTLKATQTGALTTANIINAQGKLSGDAVDLVLITTRANAATVKAAALSASYAYDPFDGLDVMYTDAATLGDAEAVIVDLDAIQANFPEGDQPKFIFDEYTEAPANMVRIVGRLAMAADLVKAGSAVVIEEE